VERRELTFGSVAASWGWCLGPMLLLAAPHYAVAWRNVATVLELNTVSPQSAVWTMSGGQPFPWFYYLTGVGGRMMLRNHLYLFVGICLASLAFVAYVRDRVAGVRHLAFALVLAVAWAVPTMLRSFNPFFTQTFTVLLLFCAVLAVCDVLPRMARDRTRFRWTWGALVAGAVAAFFIGIGSRPSGVAPDQARIRLNREIYREVLRHVRAGSGERQERVFLTCTGDVTPETLTWLARKEGLKASFHTEMISTDLDLFRREIDRSSFVLAVTARGAGKVHPWLPCAEVADSGLEIVRSRTDFREVAALGPLGTNEYHLFARDRRTDNGRMGQRHEARSLPERRPHEAGHLRP